MKRYTLLLFSLLPRSLLFLILLGFQGVRELMRRGVGAPAGRAGASRRSDFSEIGRTEELPRSPGLPLNRILYMPFRTFAYSSKIVIDSLVLIGSMLAEGTWKYSRFSLSSASFRDRAPAIKLRWCTTQPDRCNVLLSAVRKDSYCVSATLLARTM